ncbi:hypothetical protein Tdes44962_MAKER08230 [Teratosphaeria destructans]|uniref:Uncharacterized protein n=1 Tax=Teratosphaeria destructans TaxID=418781 RepID=A0A9W7SX49_9PEZI|nr:hypothetical protein Tdes44962_MAKER08230 [Teratosphaeria destructans]
MCKYQYVYYSGCGHQETTLVGYCAAAQATAASLANESVSSAPSSNASRGPSMTPGNGGKYRVGEGKRKKRNNWKTDGAGKTNSKRVQVQVQVSSRHLPDDQQNPSTRADFHSSSPPPPPPPTSTPSAARINIDISSITEKEPSEYTVAAASLTQHILRNSNKAANGMEAMRGLGNWLSSPSAKAPPTSRQSCNGTLASQLTRQHRHAHESSDESWNSVHSSESMNGYDTIDPTREDIGPAHDTDSRACPMDVVPPEIDSYALIEQDLDSMKDFVASQRIKVSQAPDRRAQQDQSFNTNVETMSTPPPDDHLDMPPHQRILNRSTKRESPAARLTRQHEQQQLKQQSARNAGLLGDSESRPQQAPRPADFPLLSDGILRVPQSHLNLRQTSYASAATIAAKGTEVKPSNTGQTYKASPTTPRFAQPTQAAVMRQTLRKDSFKTDSPPSPGKSARVVESKRKSLPEAWTSPVPGSRTQKTTPPAPTTSHVHDGGWDMIEAPQTLRKKGSFMSPTKATTQRTIATLGKDNTQRVSPRVKTASQSVMQNDGTCLSKIPVRSSGNPGTTKKPVAGQLLAGPNDRDISHGTTGGTPFASVARTTSKPRRQSAEMLGPIIQRLQDQELFSGRISTKLAGPVPKATAPTASTWSQARPRTRTSTSPPKPAALNDIALKTRQGVGNRKIAVPPHLKTRMSSAGSTATVSSQATVTVPTIVQVMDSSTDQGRKPSTLRADVPEFKPIWTPQTYAQQLSLYSWQGVLDKPLSDNAESMPSEVLESIEKLRAFKNSGTRSRGDSAGTSSSDSKPTSKRQEQRWWGKLMSQSPPLSGVQPAQHLSPEVASPGPTASPNGIRAGQTNRPSMEFGHKHVQLRLEDNDGSERPVSFGRAPGASSPGVFSTARNGPGVADDQITGLTPVMSPDSDGTGPLPRLPVLLNPAPPSTGFGMYQPFAWQIHPNATVQSGQDRVWPHRGTSNTYGWTGGDGKEIRFTGCGPYAEQDPNQSVRMQFFAPNLGRQAPNRGGAKSARRPREDEPSPTPKVWPRSMKQWAELAGTQTVPCNKAEVVSSAEMMPMADANVALCNDCQAY